MCLMYCALPTPQWKAKSQLLKSIMTLLGGTAKTENLGQYWCLLKQKKQNLFCANELGLLIRCSEILRNYSDSNLESLFVNRVKLFGKKHDSSRFTIVSQRASSHQKLWLESRYHWPLPSTRFVCCQEYTICGCCRQRMWLWRPSLWWNKRGQWMHGIEQGFSTFSSMWPN